MGRLQVITFSVTAYAALLPYYLGASGGPQPCDAALVVLAIALWWRAPALKPDVESACVRRFVRLLTLVALWGSVVNLGWFAILGSASLLATTAALIHAVIATALLVDACARVGTVPLLRALCLGLITGVCALCGAMLVSGASQSREDGFFNNPNQLGYFALCAILVIGLGHHQRAVGRSILAIAFVCGGWLALASGSKAAIAGLVVLVAIEFCRAPRATIAAIAALILLVLVLRDPFLSTHSAVDRKSRSMVSLGEARDESLDARGYPRLWEAPWHLVCGAGDGAFERFPDTRGTARELHSTVGNFAMSYGLVGLGLAVLALAAAVRGAPFLGLVSLLPIALYGLTHNGFRFRPAWVAVVAIAIVCARLQRRDAANDAFRNAGDIPLVVAKT